MLKKASILVCFLAFAVLSASVRAAELPDYITQEIDGAAIVGQGRLTFMLWDVYDATLYAPQAVYRQDAPFALSLRYLRAIDGRTIADSSAEEIRRQGLNDEVKLAAWHEQMLGLFPSVSEGTILTGLYVPGQGVRFFHDARLIGAIRDEEFALRFFDIWLGEQTRKPALRHALLGNRQ